MAREKHPSSPRFLPLTGLIPNILTILGLCTGLSAVRYAFQERWEMAVAFILFAAIIDGMDGRLARLLNATSKLGAHLDSLSDFVCFGVAPALIIYLWGLQNIEVKGLGWALVLVFSTAMALRLARFNTSLDDEDKPEWKEHFFVGVPAPAGAALLMFPLMVAFQLKDQWGINELPVPMGVIAGYMVVIALLMVSRIPTFSAKGMTIEREYVSFLLVGAVIFIALLILEPWIMLSFLIVAYLCLIPASCASYLRYVRKG
ncbi:MAG: CDP-diacylglycerol-serine O-phosphatidyltransferase [Rickettsiales bacterium]|jgi:CDP-diacylglycerol--serine O-phosphatidyltransferase|nr:CDP-diacylglycerol-serine O-phosphatidyltransferase [Rickettsiales bacterium]